MIKIFFIIILIVSLSALFGGSFTYLFSLVGQGASMLFSPFDMMLIFLNRIFVNVFHSYYLIILISIFLFISLFYITLKLFTAGVVESVSMLNDTSKHLGGIDKKLYSKFKNKYENRKIKSNNQSYLKSKNIVSKPSFRIKKQKPLYFRKTISLNNKKVVVNSKKPVSRTYSKKQLDDLFDDIHNIEV